MFHGDSPLHHAEEAARDILAEQFAHRGDVRQLARTVLENKVACKSLVFRV